MGGNTDNPDSIIYMNAYNSSSFYDKDVGFGAMMYISKLAKLTYNQFKLIVSIIGLLLIHFTAKRIVKNEFLFFLLYFIYPFFFDVVQVRNFLAMSLFLFSIPFILKGGKINILLSLFFILVAASFQKIALVYLPVVFLSRIHKKHILQGVLIALAIFSVIVGLNKSLVVEFLNRIDFVDKLSGVENYLQNNNTNGWIVFWGEQFVAFGLSLICMRRVELYYKKGILSGNDIVLNLSRLIYAINLYCFIFMPLFALDENYTRIIRNIIPIELMLFVCFFETLRSKNIKSLPSKSEVIFSVGTIGYQFLMFGLLASSYWSSIIVKVFEYNWIW